MSNRKVLRRMRPFIFALAVTSYGNVAMGEESNPSCEAFQSCAHSDDTLCLSQFTANADTACWFKLILELEAANEFDKVRDIIQGVAGYNPGFAKHIVNWRLSGLSGGKEPETLEAMTRRIQFYLELGGDPHFQQPGSFGPLFVCAMAGNAECVHILLNAGATVVSAMNVGEWLTLYQEVCFSIEARLQAFSSPEEDARQITRFIAVLMTLPDVGQSAGVKEFCKGQRGAKAALWENWPLYLKKYEEEAGAEGGS